MAVSLEQTGDIMRRSQGLINQAVDRGTNLLAERVEHYTEVANDVADVLRERGEPAAAGAVETLAGRIKGVADYLRSADGARLWSDGQNYARERTWVLAGAGFVTGIAAARAVRTATAERTWESEPAYVDRYAQPNARFAP